MKRMKYISNVCIFFFLLFNKYLHRNFAEVCYYVMY